MWTVPPGGDTPTLVPVQVVRYGQDEVQVAGLRDGQRVVTAGVQKLSPGMSVVAVDADGNPIDAGVAASSLTAASPSGRTLAATASPTFNR